MSDITIASTTDAPEAVSAAAGEQPTESAAAEQTAQPAESADESETPEEDAQESEETEGKPPKKGGFQRKIDRLTRDKYELAGRVEQLERQLAEKKPAEQAAAESKPPEGKPKAEDCDSYDEYVEKLADWKLQQKETAARAAAEQAAAEQKQREAIAAWTSRQEAARAKHADYDDVLESAGGIAITPVLQQILIDSEHGPELAYELAKSPAEVERINKLGPIAAAREIGKIEARIASAAAPPPVNPKPKASAAPPPIRPVAAAPTKTEKDPSEMSFQEYKAWREKHGR